MFFYSFKVYDQLSKFNSSKKKSAWKILNIFLKVIFFSPVERYAALIYKITTNPTTIDVARHQMFVKYNRDPHIIFSSSTALFQDKLCAAYIVDYVWNNSWSYFLICLALANAVVLLSQRVTGRCGSSCLKQWKLSYSVLKVNSIQKKHALINGLVLNQIWCFKSFVTSNLRLWR